MSDSNSNLQENMQEGRESLSFLANIATGHYFNSVFPSNLGGQQQGTVMNHQPGSTVNASGGSNTTSASNAVISQYHMGGLQTNPSVPASNPSIANGTHFTNPALTTRNCSSNPVAAGQQYLATSMSNMALNFSQGMNSMHQNTATNLPNVATGLGSVSLPSIQGGNVCFQQNLSPHAASFPLQASPLQIPSPLRHPTLLQHQLLHQQQQAVTSQQSLMQSSLQQHNALQQSIIPQQTAFMHQTSHLPQASQSSTVQQSSQQVKQSSHPSPVQQQQPSAHQESSQSPGEQPSSHLHQSLLQTSKSGKLPHLPATTSNCTLADTSFRPASKIETTSSSTTMESNAGVSSNLGLLNCNNTNSTNSNLGTGALTTSNTSTNAAGRHASSSMSEANQCSEMFNTIREALSVADNNPEVSSAASIFSEEPTYLSPSNCSLSEAASNQLLAFNFLTTSPYQLMCRHCGFSTDFHMVFTRHMACHFADKGYECPLCTIVCSSEEFLKQHVSDHLEERMSSPAKNFSGNVSVESGCKLATFANPAASFKDNDVTARYAESQTKNQVAFGAANDGSNKNLTCSGTQSNAGTSNNKGAKNNESVSGKRNSQKYNGINQKTANLSSSKGVKRKKAAADASGSKKSRSTKSSTSKSIKKNSQEVTESDDTSDENYSVSEGNSYSINKYHGPPLPHPNGFYNNKLQTNPKFNHASTPEQDDFDLYNPIDPIATTNRTLSYTDFYKKHSFMSVNSSMKSDGSSHSLHSGNNNNGMHGGNNNIGSNSFITGTSNNSVVLDAGNMNNSMNHHHQHRLPFHTNNYGAPTVSSTAKMKDPCNNYSIEQLSGHPTSTPGFMGGHNNVNPSMYGNNSSSSNSNNVNNFQSEPLSLIVNPRTAVVGSGAPSSQATAPRPVTTCRVGCSHFGRTLPGEVGPATAAANNNSSCAVSGSIASPLTAINNNMNTNGSSTSLYTLPNNGFNVSTPQTYSNATNTANINDSSNNMNSNSPNPERLESSSTSTSEHITVKIDPFDVAPSMLGAARRHHMNRQHPASSTFGVAALRSEDSSSYPGKQVAASNVGLDNDAVNVGASCFEPLSNSDQGNNNFVTLADISCNADGNILTLSSDEDEDDDDCTSSLVKKKMLVLPHLASPDTTLEGGVVDSSVYVSKTHTSKYSVNYAISDKTRNLLGSPLGGWNTSRNSNAASSASRKNRKPRDYYNRGRGYYGGRTRSGRPPYGLGSKLMPAVSSLGEPCTVEDIIDYTLGAGLKMMRPQAATGGGDTTVLSNQESNVDQCQVEVSLIKATDGLSVQIEQHHMKGSVHVTDKPCLEAHNDKNDGLLTPHVTFGNVDTFNPLPSHLLRDSDGASISEKDEEPAAVTNTVSDDVKNTSHSSDENNLRTESNERYHSLGTNTSSRCGESANVEPEPSNRRDGDSFKNSSASLKMEEASNLLLAAVGLVAASGRENRTMPCASDSLGNSKDSDCSKTKDGETREKCAYTEKGGITICGQENKGEINYTVDGLSGGGSCGDTALAVSNNGEQNGNDHGDCPNNNSALSPKDNNANIDENCTCNSTSNVCNACSIKSISDTSSALDSRSCISTANGTAADPVANSPMDSVTINSSILPTNNFPDPATSTNSVDPSATSDTPSTSNSFINLTTSSSSMDPTTSSTHSTTLTTSSSSMDPTTSSTPTTPTTSSSSLDPTTSSTSTTPTTSNSSLDPMTSSTSSTTPTTSNSSLDPMTSSTSSITPTSRSCSTNPAASSLSSSSSSLIGNSLLSSADLYACRICGFETHYQLVLARHAPSHHKKDGVIQ